VPKFGSCCLQGQIRLPPFPCAPSALQDLLCGKSPLSKELKTNIRQYNAAFAFTSLGVKVDKEVTWASRPYSFQIQGDLHHLSGSLLPLVLESPVQSWSFASIGCNRDQTGYFISNICQNRNRNQVKLVQYGSDWF
jgi:hypothetical protein